MSAEPGGGGTPRTPALRAGLARRLVPSLVLSGAVPVVVYLWLRPLVGSDVVALALGGVVPAVVTLARFVWRRRLDPVGVVSTVVFGVAVIVAALSGGNPIVLELQDAVVTGPLGLICLLSVAVGRPLHLVAFQLLARRDPARAIAWTQDPASRRASALITTLIGATLSLHAVVLLVLALTVPTATFVVVSRPVGWAVLAVGAGALLWFRARLRSGANGTPAAEEGP